MRNLPHGVSVIGPWDITWHQLRPREGKIKSFVVYRTNLINSQFPYPGIPAPCQPRGRKKGLVTYCAPSCSAGILIIAPHYLSDISLYRSLTIVEPLWLTL